MSITKKGKVSFEFKLVLDSETVDRVNTSMVSLAKRASSGEKITGEEKAQLVAALTYGVEGAIELALKKCITEELKEVCKDMELTSFGNFSVRMVK